MKTPLYVVVEPSANTTESVYDSPAVADVLLAGAVHAPTVVPSDAVLPGTMDVAAGVSAHEPPPKLNVAEEAVVLAVPELIRMRVGEVELRRCEMEVCVLTVTFAVLVALPNRPNMYPSTAAKAMSVAAMMRTVAMIGEIPFLRCPDIFIASAILPIILTIQDSGYGC